VASALWPRDQALIPLLVRFFWYILHNIQLTPQKLSAARKNLPGATGAGGWPEAQRRHRGRQTRPPFLFFSGEPLRAHGCLVLGSGVLADLHVLIPEGHSLLSTLLDASPDTTPAGAFAFTRCCFTSRLLCTNQSFCIAPPTCTAHAITILLYDYCAIYDAPPTPLLYAIHQYNIGNGNIM